jgi:hypothetical protein
MFAGAVTTGARAAPSPIVLVPLDDRPVTLQLPVMLGEIAGRRVVAPPRALLGRYLQPGHPDAILAWLNADAPRAGDYVFSSDMLAYGGLIASRVPGTSYQDAYFRLRAVERIRQRFPGAPISVFGTIMRLAPTGVPNLGDAARFFAPYPAWQYLQQYANLHDPLEPDEAADAMRLRALIGEPLLNAYLQTRARNYGVDHTLIAMTVRGDIDRLVLGQDDAKPYGLHVPELRALQAYANAMAPQRISIEAGADELGMALVARALVRGAGLRPRVGVLYSTPLGATYQDPLEFTSIGETVDRLIDLCGGERDDEHPQILLAVRLPGTGPQLDDAFFAQVRGRASVAVADLSFEEGYAVQDAFAHRLLASGIASELDAYAGWNTAANTVGTALAEAFAAAAGRKLGTYNALAHQTFTFVRFVDDVAFHDRVRPDLNAWLGEQGITDHTYLVPDAAAAAAARNTAELWVQAQVLLAQLYPDMHIAAIEITLPWDRTFETAIDVGIAPNAR